MTEAMLRGPKTALDLERITAIDRRAIRHRRRKLGIHRDEKTPNRTWVARARRLFGKVPDTEIAKRIGKPAGIVTYVRAELGIPAAPPRSAATDLRKRIGRVSKADLRRALGQLDPTSRAIFEARVLRARPESFGALAQRLGMTRQGIAWRERRAIATLMAGMAAATARGRPRSS